MASTSQQNDAVNKPDLELIAESVRGQSQAFDALVMRYQDRLFHALVQILQNREDARDIVQEAFVTAWSKLDSFRGESGFYSWLFRVAYNCAMTRKRKKQIKTVALEARAQPDSDFKVQHADNKAVEPSEGIEREERQSMVHSALKNLPEEFRTVIIMKELEDFKYEQISEILNIPIGTVRSRIHRARTLLRESLTRLLQQEDSPGPLNPSSVQSS